MGLCLKRTQHETVVLETKNGPVTVTITSPGKTRLRIDAPRDVTVLRGEILQRGKEGAA